MARRDWERARARDLTSRSLSAMKSTRAATRLNARGHDMSVARRAARRRCAVHAATLAASIPPSTNVSAALVAVNCGFYDRPYAQISQFLMSCPEAASVGGLLL